MKREEILRTAFMMAISNGWQATLDGKMLRRIGRDGKPWSWIGAAAWGSKDLLFSHDFAKALWGEETKIVGDMYTVMGNKYDVGQAAFEHYLQQMVVAEDPIKYLGDNLPPEAKS